MASKTNVIMPVLGMSQDSGKLVRWIKKMGERVEKGEPLMEVETDKANVEIEAPASGFLTLVTAQEGDDVPVTQVIAVIQESEENSQLPDILSAQTRSKPKEGVSSVHSISPLAARVAAEHKLDVGQIKTAGGRIEKADVLAHLENIKNQPPHAPIALSRETIMASPKARRLAAERGINLAEVSGNGPDGAVLADDLPTHQQIVEPVKAEQDFHFASQVSGQGYSIGENEIPISSIWERMIERLSSSWPKTPQFYLMREVNASRLITWRQKAKEQTLLNITYTDLLVKLVAASLRRHLQVNARYTDGKMLQNPDVNIGIAIATDDGLLVPVIRNADRMTVGEITAARSELVERARTGNLRLEDLQGGTFTVSNLGMYDIDAFNAMVNPGQAAILAVGRITDRVVAIKGQAVVQPMMLVSASFDHRIVDGARGAQFLQTLVGWIEEPLALLS
jgi:pyruvate dehydrogenase E2 component (dihydrolipoamide acetyltransferase)